MRAGEVTRVPKDNYKYWRTILKTSVQAQSSSSTYMPVVPRSRSPVPTSLQLQSHLSNSLLDISTCTFNSHIPQVWATLKPGLPAFPTCSSWCPHPLSRWDHHTAPFPSLPFTLWPLQRLLIHLWFYSCPSTTQPFSSQRNYLKTQSG